MRRPPTGPSPKGPERHAAACGFTLLETLLAGAVTALLLAAISGLLLATARLSMRHSTAGDAAAAADAVILRLAHELQAAQPFFGVPTSGTADTLRFTRILPVADDGGVTAPRWVVVRYAWETATPGRALVREEFVWGLDDLEGTPSRRETLLRAAEGSFDFGTLGEDQQLQWIPVWSEEAGGPPRLVQLTLRLPFGSSEQELTVHRVLRHPAGRWGTTEGTS